jgi:hypothetical protein
MSEAFTSEDTNLAAADWPLRPWLLAGLLGLAGLLIYLVTQGNDQVPWQMAVAAFLFFAAIAAAFTLERGSWKEPAVFALAVGVVMAGLAWRAVRYGENLPDEQYGFAAGVVATALALPLFQAGFLRKRMATPYPDLHYQVWTDAISAAGALAFTGLSWLALVLMSELFQLLQIDFLRELMDEGEFGWTFSGLAFGAALGTLRNQLKVLGTMQSVVLLVLSLLAVPLALGLTVFLLATAVYGPQALWEATRSATPLLLTCAAGAWVLASAIVRYEDAAMSRSRIMRIAAVVLAAVILPLAVFAAVSMGLRLDQYGLAPERLWGLVAIVVACVYGLGFWLALIRGRKSGWAAKMRQTNFHLGLFVCGLALLLALPILDFGAISARNQVARLENGKVPVEEFDFAALRWDFGEPGRRALQRLGKSDNAKVAKLADAALAQSERVHPGHRENGAEQEQRLANLQFDFDDPALRESFSDYVRQGWGNRCYSRCLAARIGTYPDGSPHLVLIEGRSLKHFHLDEGGAIDSGPPPARRPTCPENGMRPGCPSEPIHPVELPRERIEVADREPNVEVRLYRGRQVYLDGTPIGEPFD